jgi:hypothetical protein
MISQLFFCFKVLRCKPTETGDYDNEQLEAILHQLKLNLDQIRLAKKPSQILELRHVRSQLLNRRDQITGIDRKIPQITKL